jgi:hypothetical protein
MEPKSMRYLLTLLLFLCCSIVRADENETLRYDDGGIGWVHPVSRMEFEHPIREDFEHPVFPKEIGHVRVINTPEPSSMQLLIIGALILAVIIRK